MTHTEFELPNGLRVVFQAIDSPLAHCALIINAGSRDEAEDEQGMAHFIEHNLFKGTTKRKAYHILSRLDDVGGELNAYTTKEETVIHTSFLKMHLSRAMELMSDIITNSTFPEKEIKKEKDVIRDEIHAYLDSPGDSIFDDFEDLIYKNHPMGRNILGTEESLERFNRKMILAFVARNYQPQEMVLSISGSLRTNQIKKLAEKYFGAIKTQDKRAPRLAINGYEPRTSIEQKDSMQSHAIIGGRAYSYTDDKYTGFILLNNLLGGPAMNSRLNLNIREKYGFAYNIESFYTPYADSGTFGIYIGTHPGSMERSLQLIYKELEKLRTTPLGTAQLSKAKTQLIGHIALAQENNLSLTVALGKSLLNYNRIDTLADVHKKIENINPSVVIDMANEIFDKEKMSTIIYKAK